MTFLKDNGCKIKIKKFSLWGPECSPFSKEIKDTGKWARQPVRPKGMEQKQRQEQRGGPPAVLVFFIEAYTKKEKREEKRRMKVEIVGVMKGQTKTGREFLNYYGLKEFSDYDKENSQCEGLEVVKEFSYKDYGVKVGDEVEFQYEPGFNGKATLSNILMLKAGGGISPFKEEKAEKK